MKNLINKKKFDITKTFKVNEDEVQRIVRLKEITRLNQSVLLDTALEILEVQLKNGNSINKLVTVKKLNKTNKCKECGINNAYIANELCFECNEMINK
jgi:hypothetical protein